MSDIQIRALVAAACLGLAAAAGWFVTRLYYQTEISRMETQQAKDLQEQAEANTRALADAQAKSDAALAVEAGHVMRLTQQSQENQREIKRLTTGRACLSADVVRVLNIGTLPNGQHQAIQGAVNADAGSATDTDVAEWIDTARLYYGRCQSRVNALIQFYDGVGSAAE